MFNFDIITATRNRMPPCTPQKKAISIAHQAQDKELDVLYAKSVTAHVNAKAQQEVASFKERMLKAKLRARMVEDSRGFT
jgi:hypothetical protein